MNLRAAEASDLDAIMTLERASFPTDAWSEAMMREELASRHGWYVVAEEAGMLAGYAGLRAPRGAKDADIQTITIAEPFRGRGRGRMLLRALLAEADRRGVREVFLEVRADNPVAQALYASEGFTEVGRRPRYYQPDDVDAVVMRLELSTWAAARATAPSEDRTQVGGFTADAPTSRASSDLGAAGQGLRPLGEGAPACDVGTGWCT
ncbi:ribosomal-protein-alanine N-acetyltransferase [Microbacterium lushaniae]|nr:ribosomal-protein-alanine N-acetyltransferase [Microbacterium lushaniae]KAA9153221.1 ribosomal-protein-alanine N-acetyltransferase [Microbacterium lushaniae]